MNKMKIKNFLSLLSFLLSSSSDGCKTHTETHSGSKERKQQHANFFLSKSYRYQRKNQSFMVVDSLHLVCFFSPCLQASWTERGRNPHLVESRMSLLIIISTPGWPTFSTIYRLQSIFWTQSTTMIQFRSSSSFSPSSKMTYDIGFPTARQLTNNSQPCPNNLHPPPNSKALSTRKQLIQCRYRDTFEWGFFRRFLIQLDNEHWERAHRNVHSMKFM